MSQQTDTNNDEKKEQTQQRIRRIYEWLNPDQVDSLGINVDQIKRQLVQQKQEQQEQQHREHAQSTVARDCDPSSISLFPTEEEILHMAQMISSGLDDHETDNDDSNNNIGLVRSLDHGTKQDIFSILIRMGIDDSHLMELGQMMRLNE